MRETKTKDNVFVTMRVAIQYSIIDQEEKQKAAHYRLTNPRQQVWARLARARGRAYRCRRPRPAHPPLRPPPLAFHASSPAALPRTPVCPSVCLSLTLSVSPHRLSAVQIQNYVFDVVRSSVPKIDLDDVFTTKEEISTAITESLKAAMSDFGYQILSTPITDIDPDREVKRAMNELNKMKRLRVAAEDEGEAQKIRAVKEAEAEAGRTEIQAKAEAEAKFLGGQGISRQRQAIMEGLRESVNAFKSEVKNVEAKTVMDLMLVTQYFDMMKDVGAQGKTTAVFLDDAGGMSSQIAKGFMSGLPAAPGFAQPMGR